MDLEIEGSRSEIASLTFALERNESMIRALHKALEVLLSYIAYERKLLQESHRDQLSSSQ